MHVQLCEGQKASLLLLLGTDTVRPEQQSLKSTNPILPGVQGEGPHLTSCSLLENSPGACISTVDIPDQICSTTMLGSRSLVS